MTGAPKHTPGPWDWVIHDHSLASLGVLPDPGLGDPLVLAIGPCGACANRADPKEWKWGRCHTPSEADARLIAAAPAMYEALDQAEACMSIVEPRSNRGEYLRILGVVRTALAATQEPKP